MKGLKINVKLATKITHESSNSDNDSEKISKMECSKIMDNIYLSGSNISLNQEFLIKGNFTHILNCAAGSKSFKTQIFEQFEYLLLDLKDDPGFDIIYAIFKTIDFVEMDSKRMEKF